MICVFYKPQLIKTFIFSNASTPTYLTTDGGAVKRIFTTPIVSTIGNGTATTFQPTVTVSTPPFGTPAAITGGRPPTAILTAAGVTNIPTTLGNNNMKPECNGASNQQAVIVQQPSNNATATLFNNINNGHHPNIVNFSSSPSITLIPASATSTASTNSPVNLSGVTVTPTPLPNLTSGSTNNTASRVATAIVMPTQPSINANSLAPINSAPMSSVTVSLSSASEKLQQISQPSPLQKIPSSVVSINPASAVTVVPAPEASNPSFQVGNPATRNNNFSSVEVRPIKENDQPDSKRPRLENPQTE